MAASTYDRERAKRYKRWWAKQRGAPKGELIEVPLETWERRDHARDDDKEGR
ncbi:MAG: hypothetical protein HY815_20850 [Candidatus Riflebacteria bacterium]|nr:hypothetical protein [Candidatus Riflebacteria bacterium]